MTQFAKLKYKILPEFNLIIDSYSGNLTTEEILFLKGEQTKDPLWDPTFNTLSDMRNSSTVLDEMSIKKLASYQVRDERWSHPRRTASLTNQTNQVVYETLFNLLKPKNSKVLVKAFSTIDAAMRWLDLDLQQKSLIENTLKKLAEE